jgi:hypothetical protein
MAAKFIPGSGEKALTKLEWDMLLGEHMAVVDVPAAWFGPELAELYPDAKVIVTTRDKEAWYRSCVAAFTHRKWSSTPLGRFLFTTMFMWNKAKLELIHFMDRKQVDVWKFEWHDEKAKPAAMRSYDEYYDEVRTRIPESKRIEFTVQDGWSPLCAHLGVEVPTALVEGERVEVPFPRSNDAEAFVALVSRGSNRLYRGAMNDWAVRIVGTAMAGYILYPHAIWLIRQATRLMGQRNN